MWILGKCSATRMLGCKFEKQLRKSEDTLHVQQRCKKVSTNLFPDWKFQ